MKRIVSAIVMFAALFAAGLAQAQNAYWVQLSANATLREAEDDARAYASRLEGVNGFRLGNSGWYAVTLGPFTAEAATATLIELRAAGRIPSDAYISDGAPYRQRFWPVGSTRPAAAAVAVEPLAPVAAPQAPEVPAAPPTPEAPVASEASVTPEAPVAPVASETVPVPAPLPETPVVAAPAAAPVPEPAVIPVEETRKQARAAERALDGEARKALQVALKWEGFYRSAIDGDFGPGTRSAMSAWQAAKGYEETGILTTRQRAELLGGYNEAMASIGLAQVRDARAGIQMTIPAAMVGFTRYEAPFAHYEGDEGVRVVLISQRGDKATLWGLYDILQTLAVVPPEGNRKRGDKSFTIEGANEQIVSFTEAKLVDGAVKGWMLVWPQGAEQVDAGTGATTRKPDPRFAVVRDAMRESFASLGEAALDDNAGLDSATQSIDLISGLEIRRPAKSRSGFYVSDTGAVLTTTEAVEGCRRITLDEAYDAQVTARDEGLGLALLIPAQALSPLEVAAFLGADPRLQSELAVAGYSYGGRLSSPTLTYGRLAELRGLSGEPQIARLEINAQDGDTGGPVIDRGGAVAGMLLATPSANGRVLPADVGFIAKGSVLGDFLAQNGIEPRTTAIAGALSPYELSGHAADLTVLVSCWE